MYKDTKYKPTTPTCRPCRQEIGDARKAEYRAAVEARKAAREEKKKAKSYWGHDE